MKHITFLITVILFASSCANSQSSSAIDSELTKIASEVNKTLPMNIDRETILENCVAMPGKVLGYYYKLPNISIEDVDTATFRKILTPQIKETIKTNPDMKYLRDKDVTFHYNYKDKNSTYLLKIIVTPEDYQSVD